MLDSFVAWLMSVIQDIAQWVIDSLVAVLEWIYDKFIWLFEKLWELLLSGLAAAFEAIPVPDFMAQAGGFFGQIPSSIVYFFQFFAIAEGLAMIIAALTLRFILRRIPFIG